MSDSSIWGSEWGYFDNTKHLIFWLCNIKQLNFRHFNTNSKKIFCNSKFYQEGNKNGFKQGNVILLSISRSFRPLSDDFRSFRKISEDVRKLLKFSKKKFRQMLLDGTTLDCFERSRMTLLLCLSKLPNHPRFYRSSLELWQHRRRIHSMPPSASTLTKGSWAPDTRLVPSIPQNTVANGWKNETTATAPLSMGSKFTGGLSRAERLWVFHENPSNT